MAFVVQDPLVQNQTIPENIPSEHLLLEELTLTGDEAAMDAVESAIEEVLRSTLEIPPEVAAPIEVSSTPIETITIEGTETITDAAQTMNLDAPTFVITPPLTEETLLTEEVVKNTPVVDAIEATVGGADQISSTAVYLTADPVSNILSSPAMDPSLIPLPPLPPIALPTPSMGDLPFAELGLNSWWPPGWIQWFMEFSHVSLGLPWWGTIVCTGVILRIVTIPLFILSQRAVAQNSHIMPKFMELQKKLNDAKFGGDWADQMRAQNKMAMYMKSTGYSPFATMKPTLFQAPIFMSVFLGIRKMVNLPVESMTHGGLFWFTNLTVSDPYYIFPLFNALSLLLQLELGVEMMSASKMPTSQKWMMRCIPMVMFPFLCFQTTALCLYWSVSIWMAFLLKSGLRFEPVRLLCKIPKNKPIDVGSMMKSAASKDFSLTSVKQDAKKKWKTYRTSKLATGVEKKDETMWREAGIKGAVKTYKYDPTKVKRVA